MNLEEFEISIFAWALFPVIEKCGLYTAKNAEPAVLPVLYCLYNRLQQYYADLFCYN